MTNSSEPLVSVVTPFYNGAAYLRQAAESVLRQTYRNLEYVLVDNHSKDGASEIARDIAAGDPRVRVVSPPTFLAQDDNFNYAVEQASPNSKYVKMLFGDDWLFPTCLSEMVALAEAHPRVGIVSSYRLRGPNVDGNGIDPERTVLSGREVCRMHLLSSVFLFGSPTTLLYRSDMVRARRPFFAPNRLHTDTEAAFEVLEHNDFGFVPQILSFSRTQTDSEMGSRRFFVPEALDRLLMVTQYGPRYLTPEEHRTALKKASRWHYSVLAQGLIASPFAGSNSEFWQYHRRGLDNIGGRVQPLPLAAAVARVTLRGLLSPVETFKTLRRVATKPEQRDA